MGNILTPYSVAVGYKNISFLTSHFKFIEREKNKNNELFKTNKTGVDPLDHHIYQIVEYTRLKNYEHIKLIQIMIRTNILLLVQIILISRKWD